MKLTVVPAQITSVEDRIAGNLSFKQLLLIITPVFLSMAVFVLLPPFTRYHWYKLVISICTVSLCLTLAVRVRDQLVAEWIGTLSRYNLRPRYYVFNKNDMTARTLIETKSNKLNQVKPEAERLIPRPRLAFTTNEFIDFEHTLANPRAELYFLRSKKGGLRVHIKEVE
jgi:hypothetical protein